MRRLRLTWERTGVDEIQDYQIVRVQVLNGPRMGPWGPESVSLAGWWGGVLDGELQQRLYLYGLRRGGVWWLPVAAIQAVEAAVVPHNRLAHALAALRGFRVDLNGRAYRDLGW